MDFQWQVVTAAHLAAVPGPLDAPGAEPLPGSSANTPMLMTEPLVDCDLTASGGTQTVRARIGAKFPGCVATDANGWRCTGRVLVAMQRVGCVARRRLQSLWWARFSDWGTVSAGTGDDLGKTLRVVQVLGALLLDERLGLLQGERRQGGPCWTGLPFGLDGGRVERANSRARPGCSAPA